MRLTNSAHVPRCPETCVLMPGQQRDFLLQLATERAFAPLWGTGILFELDLSWPGWMTKAAGRTAPPTAADHWLLPAPLALGAVDEAGPFADQGVDWSEPGRCGVAGSDQGSKPVRSGVGQLLPHRQRGRQVRRIGPTRNVAAAPLAGQEAGPQPAGWSGEPLDPDLVPRPGTSQAHGHHHLPEGSVIMSGRPSVSRMRENRTYGLKGGRGTRTAQRHLHP